MYSPIMDEDSDDIKKDKLAAVDALIKSRAKDAGSVVVIGHSSVGRQVKRFYRDYVCGFCNTNNTTCCGGNAAQEKETIPDDKYRDTHLNNNVKGIGRRKGSGRGGPGLHRKRNKVLRGITCPFRFRLRVDEGGFYITVFRGAGISLHQGHPRFDPKFVTNQSSSLTQEEKKDAQHVVRSTINKAAGREFIKAKFGKFLPSSQIAYLSAIRADYKLDEHSSLIEMFEESENVRYNLLWSIKKGDDIEVLSSTKIAGEVTQESPLLQGDEEKQLLPVATNAVEQRKSRGIGDEEQVFHCIAWTHEDLLRYFLLCPEVVTFDVTSHTNASGYHHLSFSCRTSIDKQVLFCRIWIPDQRRVSFRYVFQEALPRILPTHVLTRVKFLMCDGDPQQNIEIRLALQHLFPCAIVALCVYHLVNMGWNRHVCTANFKSQKRRKMPGCRLRNAFMHGCTLFHVQDTVSLRKSMKSASIY